MPDLKTELNNILSKYKDEIKQPIIDNLVSSNQKNICTEIIEQKESISTGIKFSVYIIYILFIKTGYTEKDAITMSVLIVSSWYGVNDVESIKEDFNITSKKFDTIDTKEYFNKSINEIMKSIKTTYGIKAEVIFNKYIPRLITFTMKSYMETAHPVYDFKDVKNYLETDFKQIKPDEYNGCIHEFIKLDPGLLIRKEEFINDEDQVINLEFNSSKLLNMLKQVGEIYDNFYGKIIRDNKIDEDHITLKETYDVENKHSVKTK